MRRAGQHLDSDAGVLDQMGAVAQPGREFNRHTFAIDIDAGATDDVDLFNFWTRQRRRAPGPTLPSCSAPLPAASLDSNDASASSALACSARLGLSRNAHSPSLSSGPPSFAT